MVQIILELSSKLVHLKPQVKLAESFLQVPPVTAVNVIKVDEHFLKAEAHREFVRLKKYEGQIIQTVLND